MQKLPQRQQQVLKATVHHYVDTMEPVGSKILVQRFGLKACSATIRSAMGALERKGFLIQPHISSGRVPSPRGYRHYVDSLLPPPSGSVQHLASELTTLSLKFAALDDLLFQLSRRLTDFTGLMSLITRPVINQSILQTVRLVHSGERLLVMLVEGANQVSHLNLRMPIEVINEIEPLEVWIREQINKSNDGKIHWTSLPPQLHLSGSVVREAIHSHYLSKSSVEDVAVSHGISRLASQPEFSDINKFRPLLELLDSDPRSVVPSTDKSSSRVWIGSENPNSALVHCSVVQASYRSHQGMGQVALIGPMRMSYSTAIASVHNVANHLQRLLS